MKVSFFNPLKWFSLNFCLFLIFLGCSSKKTSEETIQPQEEKKIYSVKITNVESIDLPTKIEESGVFIAQEKLEVKATLVGKISSVSITEGQKVNANELLAVIDPEYTKIVLEKLNAELRENEAKLEVARSPIQALIPTPPLRPTPPQNNGVEIPRPIDEVGEEILENPQGVAPDPTPPQNLPPLNQPGDSGLLAPSPIAQPPRQVPEEVLRSYEASIDRVKAEILMVEKQLEGSNIVSGISGIVAQKNISTGSQVNEGDILFQIVKLDPILFSLFVSEEEVKLFDGKGRFDVFLEGTSANPFAGEVVFVAPEQNEQKKYEVRLAVVNPTQRIKSGMKGKMNLVLPPNSQKKVTVILEDAVLERKGKIGVYVVKNQMARFQEVKTGRKFENKIEIISGLDLGDSIATRGIQDFLEETEVAVKVE